MKAIALIGILMGLAQTSMARDCWWSTDSWGNRTRHCSSGHRHHRRHHHHTHVDVDGTAVVGAAAVVVGAALLSESCAPEVTEGNISATDRVLEKLATSKEFEANAKFQAKVSEIKAITDTKVKMSEYFKLVDVESAEDVAFFVGARKDEYGKYASTLAAKLELDAEQSELVVQKLTESLKGSLR